MERPYSPSFRPAATPFSVSRRGPFPRCSVFEMFSCRCERHRVAQLLPDRDRRNSTSPRRRIDDTAASNNGAVNRDECVKLKRSSVASVPAPSPPASAQRSQPLRPAWTVNQPKATYGTIARDGPQAVRESVLLLHLLGRTDSAAASPIDFTLTIASDQGPSTPRFAFRPHRQERRDPPPTMRTGRAPRPQQRRPAPAQRRKRVPRRSAPATRSFDEYTYTGASDVTQLTGLAVDSRRVVQRRQSDPRLGMSRQLRSAKPLRELPRRCRVRVRTPVQSSRSSSRRL